MASYLILAMNGWAQGPGQGIAAALSLMSLGLQKAATNI